MAANERYHEYVNINSRRTILFFAMSLIFPLVGLVLCSCYLKGARLDIRKYMNDPHHFSTLASLFWIGQSFTIFVIVLDIFAINEERAINIVMKKLEDYQLNIVKINLAIECVTCLFPIVILLMLGIIHCHDNITGANCERLIKCCFGFFFCPIFCCTGIKYKEARLWFLVMGFLPPLWSFLSHVGYIFGGWISYEDRSIALILFYVFSFIFLYWSLQYVYRCIIDLYLTIKKSDTTEPSCKQEMEEYKKVLYDNDAGVNTFTLIFMFIPCFALNLIIACIGYLIVHLPVLESIDDALTRIYILGEYTFIFAIFFLAYNLVHLKGERGDSRGGLINKEVLKFWKCLYRSDIDIPDIHSDKDRAPSLLAVLMYRLMGINNVNQERYNTLLNKIIMEEGDEEGYVA